MPVAPAAATPASPAARFAWPWLLGFLLLLLALIGLERGLAYREIGRSERIRMQSQSRVVEEEIVRLLGAIDRALIGLRDDFPDAETVSARQTFRLKALAAVMPGVRTLFTLDAQGMVRTSSNEQLLGLDLSGRAYFTHPQKMAQPEALYLSAPFKTVLGAYTVTVSRELRRRDGQFSGLAVVGLEPDYFASVMRSVLYAPDMQATLAHGDGTRFVQVPAVGLSDGDGDAAVRNASLWERRSVLPAALPLDKALVVTVSRELSAIYAPWRQQTAWMLAFWGLFSTATCAMLRLTQQRQRALDAQAQAHLAVLSESEESLAITLASIGDAVVATDAAGNVQRMNPCAETLIGLTLAQARGRPLAEVFRIVDAQTRSPVPDPVARVLAQGVTVGLANSTLLLAHDGREYPIADSAAPIRSPAGAIVGVVLVFSDVTARYRSDRVLRDRERQLTLLTDALPGPVSRIDRDGRYLFANAAYKTWLGLDPAQVVGRTHAEVLPPALMARIAPMLARARAGELMRYEVEVSSPAHGLLHGLVTLLPYRDEQGELQGHFTVVVDITERKRAELAMRESEQRWKAVIDNLAEGLILSDGVDSLSYVNPAALKIHGFKSLEECRQALASVREHYEFSELDGTSVPFEQWPLARLHRGDTLREWPLQVRRRHSAWERIFLYSGATVNDAAGRQVAFLAVSDITEARQAEAALRRSRDELEHSAALLQMASRAAQLGGWAIDARTGELQLSDELCVLIDLPPGAPLSLEDAIAMYPPGSREIIAEVIRACLEEGTPFDVELEVFTARQRRLQMRSAGMAVRDAEGHIVRAHGAFQDISERKKTEAERRDLEAQLRESQKMESVGTLAGGIAHDFNNMLGAILGNVALARDDVGPGHPALLSLDQIQTAGLRARAMVQQILAFSRRQPHALVVQPLRPVVEEALALLRATLPARVRLTTRFGSVPLQVKADATQIQQVILNLCTNAWHAMQGSSGVIEVGLDHAALDAPTAQRLSGLSAGDYAHVWVSDTGAGIDAVTLQRIFEPFFTTKPVGEGTGLGLSVVHGIVLSHRGAINVDSAPGKGATFHLYFPAVVHAAQDHAGALEGAEPLRGQGQHVLYTDDDEVMVLLVERLLRRLNYRVTSHSDPRKALDDFRGRPQAFDLVVTDFNMPEMSGLEVAEAVLALRPGLPVVISSGYLSEELRAAALRLGVRSLMQKQNTHDELGAVVHGILARREGGDFEI
ncbi:MAG TPA: PAS domain-containing protein [Ideonella sp.]|nr:PAS domain-containing protein [Ideonella sp.]